MTEAWERFACGGPNPLSAKFIVSVGIHLYIYVWREVKVSVHVNSDVTRDPMAWWIALQGRMYVVRTRLLPAFR